MNVLRAPLALSFVCLLAVACGGDSKEDAAAVCKKGCSQGVDLCFPDAGTAGSAFKATCEAQCASGTTSGGKPCSNSSAMITASRPARRRPPAMT